MSITQQRNMLSSSSTRKQRKFRKIAAFHLRGRLLSSHLSPKLREQYKARSARVRKGDKVKVLRGQFKGQEATIDSVDMNKLVVHLDKTEQKKRDGSKVNLPMDPSNLMIIELVTDDKRRFKRRVGATPSKGAATTSAKAVKPAASATKPKKAEAKPKPEVKSETKPAKKVD